MLVVALLVFSFIQIGVSATTNPCFESLSVDITNGAKKANRQIFQDDVMYDSDNYYVKDGRIFGCPCNLKKCVRKCCGKKEIIVNRTCTPSDIVMQIPIHRDKELIQHLNPEEGASGYFFIHKRCRKAFRLYPETYPDTDQFFIQQNGHLIAPDLGIDIVQPHGYCVDIFHDVILDRKFTALVCSDEVLVEDSLEGITMQAKSVGMIISMPFLIITFVVYAILPDRNLHMKALMCYVINLLFAYIFLVSIQLTDQVIENNLCEILGFCCVFFFLASFFWMNVICVDIFLGFRGFRGVPGARSSERKRFLLYCLYAWGMALFIVAITFVFNRSVDSTKWFFPGVGAGQCFIRNGVPQLLYFYGPMGAIILFNVILFTLTALKIRQVKKDTAMLKHSESKRHSDDDQQNFNLYLKLLLAMGVNWSMEFLSWLVNLNNQTVPQYVWYLTDFCNATYGVFIFFIFVFKRNIWRQLKRRYYSFTGRHHLAHSMTATTHTKTTNDSVTASTLDRAMEESELNVSRIN